MEFTLTGLILPILIICLFFIQLYYWQRMFNGIHLLIKKPRKRIHNYPPISVILVSKDTGIAIEQNLIPILEQDYPTFEVIVVNDQSNDDYDDTLTLLESKYHNLYHTFIPGSAKYISHKKLGISMGIKASHYDWLVFTEIYCKPSSNQWLKMLSENFTDETDIVLGYSNYEKADSWFNKKITYDKLINSMRFLSMAIMGMPYMGNGKNLAYRKSLFMKQNGFTNQLKWKHGEDDLFINQAAKKKNTRVEVSRESIIRISMPTKRTWENEKINYAATSQLFKGIGRFIVGFETFTRNVFYCVTIYSLITGLLFQQWMLLGIATSCLITQLIVEIKAIHQTTIDLGEREYCFLIPIFNVIQPLWNWKFKLRKAKSHQNNFQKI